MKAVVKTTIARVLRSLTVSIVLTLLSATIVGVDLSNYEIRLFLAKVVLLLSYSVLLVDFFVNPIERLIDSFFEKARLFVVIISVFFSALLLFGLFLAVPFNQFSLEVVEDAFYLSVFYTASYTLLNWSQEQ